MYGDHADRNSYRDENLGRNPLKSAFSVHNGPIDLPHSPHRMRASECPLGLDLKDAKQPTAPRQIFVGLAAFLFIKLALDLMMPASQQALAQAKDAGDAAKIEAAEKRMKTAEIYSQYLPVVQSVIQTLRKAELLRLAQAL